MKKLLTIILFAAISFAANAQTATVTLDASGSGVSGGDGTGKIVSANWTVQGTPPAAVTFSAPTALVTSVTVTKDGTYDFLLTVTDNLNQVTTGVIELDVFKQQIINIKFAAVKISTILK